MHVACSPGGVWGVGSGASGSRPTVNRLCTYFEVRSMRSAATWLPVHGGLLIINKRCSGKNPLHSPNTVKTKECN